MDKIIGVIGGVPDQKSRNDDDFSDRLSHRFTTAILVFCAVIVSTKQYVGDPINCWVPAHFSGNHETYTNNYCWIRNTYWLPFEEYIPHEHEDDKRHMIPYYQWMPMILLVQGLLFYLPIILWRTLNGRSGIDVDNIVETAEKFETMENAEAREATLKYMTKQMDRYLASQQQYKTGCTVSLKHCLSRTICMCCGRRHGNYLSVLYLFCKLLFIANVIGQLFALNTFLGHDFNMYGIDVLRSVARGEDWTQSPRFPRVTMCDLKVRRLGNVQRYTVQCVLPINLFNEKIYLFLWFWMVMVAAVTVFSFLTWLMRTALKTDGQRYVKKHLNLMEKLQDKDRVRFQDFMDKYLRQDGVFVLRLVGHNTTAITVTEFVCALWEHYLAQEREKLTQEDNLDPV